MGREGQADGRKQVTRRWNGPLTELCALRLTCAQQLGREHQRAGAGGDAKEFATVDHRWSHLSMMFLMPITKLNRPSGLLLLKLQRTTTLDRSAGNMMLNEL